MNILYISSKKRWGGVSSWMEKTARGLAKRGHRVWILAHPEGRFYRSAASDLQLLPFKLGMDYNPLSILFVVWQIKTKGIDLTVTNIEKEVICGGIAARLGRIPNIRRVGREDDFNTKFKVKLHHRLLVDRCIVPCDWVRDHAVQRAPWLDAGQFVTIYNGQNDCHFEEDEIRHQRRLWGVTGENLIIGTTAQLSDSKGLDALIRVFGRLTDRFPDIRLVITGEGRLKESLQNLVQGLDLAARVIFAGFSSQPLKAAAAYDSAVCNSTFEGFPNTVVEYFAAARPVVAANAGGVAEMVHHEENALLIGRGDGDDLYRSLVRLIESPDLRQRLGRNARSTIQAGFSEDHMLDRLEALYAAVVRHEAFNPAP
jgi:glycosyltransferase involved in cell wall biosynthesis